MHLLSLSLCVLRSPIDTFRAMQADRRRFSFLPACILMLLAVCVRIASIYLTHFPIRSVEPAEANLLMESAMMLAPMLMWAVANFAVTSIMDGETMMRESLTATAYCMMPYIVLCLPLAALTNLMGLGEISLYRLMQGCMWGWCAMLLVLSIAVMNNYTVLKSLGIVVLNLLVMALMAAVMLLMYALANQLIMFVEGVAREVTYAFR